MKPRKYSSGANRKLIYLNSTEYLSIEKPMKCVTEYSFELLFTLALSIPPGVKGTAASVTVQPKILPLFLGKMQITDLRLDSAKLNYTLPTKPASAKTTPQPFSYYNLAKRIQPIVTTLPAIKIPDLDFRVNDSSANLFIGKQKFLELAD